ncbi:metabotropic glutamate receptor [Plakobranchus ocellatus]|uniref:Metabotropic glutamate receptor n=1 Tax=Plakobranchus ocellatus TaxID=259542 RepID=A0AAV4AAB6_9GAST|nr:metabotropic glutamate receptor [Plakobranchus ocellatus]
MKGVLFTFVWLLLEPPGTRLSYPDSREPVVILKCSSDDISFLVSLIYNMLLIIVCTVYAVKTRKIPENFNESKFIGFSMYTTCIIWLAFVPIYFGTLNSFKIQVTTLCVSISLSASVALLCLFLPKVYIIVFQPQKNVRKLTMNSASYKMAPTASSATGNNHNSSKFIVYILKLFPSCFSILSLYNSYHYNMNEFIQMQVYDFVDNASAIPYYSYWTVRGTIIRQNDDVISGKMERGKKGIVTERRRNRESKGEEEKEKMRKKEKWRRRNDRETTHPHIYTGGGEEEEEKEEEEDGADAGADAYDREPSTPVSSSKSKRRRGNN